MKAFAGHGQHDAVHSKLERLSAGDRNHKRRCLGGLHVCGANGSHGEEKFGARSFYIGGGMEVECCINLNVTPGSLAMLLQAVSN